MKWILIFGFLIGVVLLFLQKSMFFLSGINSTVVVPFLLIIGIVTIVFLLIKAIKLYRDRDLKGQITTLKGFYFVFKTFLLGIIISEFSFYFTYVTDLDSIPRRYYSGNLEDLITSNFGLGGFSILMDIIQQYFKLFVFVSLISLIIAKIFSKRDPSV